MSDPKVLLLSIKPKYVQKILDGYKSIELRKVRPQVQEGDFILMYESSPTKALIGWCKVKNVICENPQALWKTVEARAGVTYTEFNSYYKNSKLGFGIYIDLIHTPRKVSLEDIRKQWRDFRPPQSFYYLKTEEIPLAEQILEHNLPKRSLLPQFSLAFSESLS
ncbi:ASCH domain-containing protein [Prochlorothrix hollandica]|uniref:ASCH domain-containing protein n=1 Tax=Prochlorothrix hollandica TaxID=1223 RepID=UPI00333F85CD